MLIDNWKNFSVQNERACPVAYRFFATYRRIAQRFLFTDESTEMAARLAADYPNTILHNYQFALPPYPTTYIEYNNRAWVAAFGKEKYQSSENHDFNVGHLIHDNTLGTAIDLQEPIGKARNGICPWMYTLDYSKAHIKNMKRVQWFPKNSGKLNDPKLAHAAILFGSTLSHEKANLTDELIEDLTTRIGLHFEHTIKLDSLEDLVKTFIGEMRTIWSLLLFINQPTHIVFDEIPANARMIGSNRVAFPSFRLVRVKPKTTIHHIRKELESRNKPGHHQVREFWRNFDKNDQCQHSWPLMPDEEGVFQCQSCSQWRVRVKSHWRGDERRPVIRRGYKV